MSAVRMRTWALVSLAAAVPLSSGPHGALSGNAVPAPLQPTGVGIVASYVWTPRAPEVFYALPPPGEPGADRGRLWVTRNAGATWSTVLLPPGCSSVAVAYQSPQILACAGAQGLYLSQDSARTWQPRSRRPLAGYELYFRPDRWRTLLAVPQETGGALVTRDAGLTWRSVAFTPFVAGLVALDVASLPPASADGYSGNPGPMSWRFVLYAGYGSRFGPQLLVSRDGGSSFRGTGRSLPDPRFPLVQDPRRPPVLYQGDEVSADFGRTWRPLRHLPPWALFEVTSVSPRDPRVLAGLLFHSGPLPQEEVELSPDGGRTWRTLARGPAWALGRYAQFDRRGRLWAFGGQAIFRPWPQPA